MSMKLTNVRRTKKENDIDSNSLKAKGAFDQMIP